MKSLLIATALLLAISLIAHAAETLPPPAPLGKGATKAYRQVLPDGSIVYSDKPVKGAKIAETIEVEPAPERAPLAVDADRKPAAKPRPQPVPVRKVAKVPPPDRRMTADEAQSEVVRAEMQLEDAKQRQQAGVEPQPGERTGNVGGGSRLNESYWRRQQELAQDVEQARDELRRAESERDTLLPVH